MNYTIDTEMIKRRLEAAVIAITPDEFRKLMDRGNQLASESERRFRSVRIPTRTDMILEWSEQ